MNSIKKIPLLLIIPLLVFLGCHEAQYCRNDCNKKCKAQVCRNIEDVGYYTNANLTSIQMYTSELIFVPAKFRKNYGWEITRYNNWDNKIQTIITRDYSSCEVLKKKYAFKYFDIDTTLKYVINTNNDLIGKVKYLRTEHISDDISSSFQHIYAVDGGVMETLTDNRLLILNFIPKTKQTLTSSNKKKYNKNILEKGFTYTNNISYSEGPLMRHFEDKKRNLKYSFISFYNEDNNYPEMNFSYFVEYQNTDIITNYTFKSYVFDVLPLKFLINNQPVFLIELGAKYSDMFGASILYFNGTKYDQM